MSLRSRLRDWWRGYTNDDLRSLGEKMKTSRVAPEGSVVELTRAEAKALWHVSPEVYLQTAIRRPME
jgi:hypothetical protein